MIKKFILNERFILNENETRDCKNRVAALHKGIIKIEKELPHIIQTTSSMKESVKGCLDYLETLDQAINEVKGNTRQEGNLNSQASDTLCSDKKLKETIKSLVSVQKNPKDSKSAEANGWLITTKEVSSEKDSGKYLLALLSTWKNRNKNKKPEKDITDWAEKNFKEALEKLKELDTIKSFSDLKKGISHKQEEVTDWKDKYDNLAGGALELKNFWSAYFKNYFPGYEEDINNLGPAFKKEIVNYDFETEANPFFGYLKHLCGNERGNSLPALPCYTAIHNAFVKKYITRLNLAGAFTPDNPEGTGIWKPTVDLLFNENFFNKNSKEALNLLNLQRSIGKKVKTLKPYDDFYERLSNFIKPSDKPLETYQNILFSVFSADDRNNDFKTVELVDFASASVRWEKLSNEKISEAKYDWVKEKSINSIINDGTDWSEKDLRYALSYLYSTYKKSLDGLTISGNGNNSKQKIAEYNTQLRQWEPKLKDTPTDSAKNLIKKFDNYEIAKDKSTIHLVFSELYNKWASKVNKEKVNKNNDSKENK